MTRMRKSTSMMTFIEIVGNIRSDFVVNILWSRGMSPHSSL